MSKKLYIILILFFIIVQGKAQQAKSLSDRFFIDAELLTGNTWAHHKAINYLLEYPPAGTNFKFGLNSDGSRDWHIDLNYPRYGVGYQYARLGSDILGNSHALYLFIGSDFLNSKRWSWHYDLGAGVGFIDNPYDEEKNPLNIVNGSVTNAFLRVATGVGYKISARHNVGINGGLFHLSNGNSSLPNWGINTLYLSLNWEYLFSDSLQLNHKTKSPTKQLRITAYGSGGYKEERPVDRIKYIVSDWHINVWRKFRPGFSYGAGLSLFYDGASKKMLWRSDYEGKIPLSDFDVKAYEYWSLGAQAGYMLNMHPVYFSFEFGVYLYSAVNRDIYNRWLLEVLVTDNLRVYGGLKSRFGKADFVEYGIAYDILKFNR
ncbi:hypothetical protein L21SP5_01013 [Salinivirga cyanobacteriivorans]|uniref:Lipid A 3-O-deacylase (PagL) n=1 Tax=Salinivirga cyanobacteriivorans TaxID=1307839 RepID=A0A0S2HXB7_9BACT|nr:acyloxyacyl hydrolase [Salinivirga cyanobacteriivorans]ALO14680.1 hypothetical protein L21SP5_01013 [Salinivirga cyanobacteriivorans]